MIKQPERYRSVTGALQERYRSVAGALQERCGDRVGDEVARRLQGQDCCRARPGSVAVARIGDVARISPP